MLRALAFLLPLAHPRLCPASQEDVPTMIGYLKAGDWNERLHAVYGLGAMGPSARTPLRLALKDLDWQIRLTAVHWLGRMGPPAIPELSGVLRSEPCRLVRLTAAHWLGSMGPKALPALERSVALEESSLMRVSDRYWLRRYEPDRERSLDNPAELEQAGAENMMSCESSDEPGLLPGYALTEETGEAAADPAGDPPVEAAPAPGPAAADPPRVPGEVAHWVRQFSTTIEARQRALDELAPDHLLARAEGPGSPAHHDPVGHRWAESSRLPESPNAAVGSETASAPGPGQRPEPPPELRPPAVGTERFPDAPGAAAASRRAETAEPARIALRPEPEPSPPLRALARRETFPEAEPAPASAAAGTFSEPPPEAPARPSAAADSPPKHLGKAQELPVAPAPPGRAPPGPEAPPETERDAGMKRTHDPLPELLSALASGDSNLRYRAADELGAMGPKALPAVTRLIRALEHDKARKVRAGAALALGNIGSADSKTVEALARALKDSDFDVEFSAARALGRLAGPEARRAFQKYQRETARSILSRQR